MTLSHSSLSVRHRYQRVRARVQATKTVVSRAFREQVLRLIIRLYEQLANIQPHDWVTVCQCLMLMDDADEVARILGSMLESDDALRNLLAFQIGFDLFENDMQVRTVPRCIERRHRAPGPGEDRARLAPWRSSSSGMPTASSTTPRRAATSR